MANVEDKLQNFMSRFDENYAVLRFWLVTMLNGKEHLGDVHRNDYFSEIKTKVTNIIVSALSDVLQKVSMDEGASPFSMIELLNARFVSTRTFLLVCSLFYFFENGAMPKKISCNK